jgi:hypothetical protein
LNNPLVSLTIPLYGVFWADSFQKESGEAVGIKLVMVAAYLWLIGYATTWSTKWLLAGLFADGVFPTILENIKFRLGGVYGTLEMTWTNAFSRVLSENHFGAYFILASLIVSLLPLIHFVKTIRRKWSDLTSFVFICALPFAWFAGLRNHTIIHAAIASAGLYISFAMVLSALLMSWADNPSLSSRLLKKNTS